MRGSFLAAGICLVACVHTINADLIVQKPLSGKTGPEKLLVIINGAYVANEHYQDVGSAIQAASSMKLWIAIPSFVLNCPNPGEINSKIKGAVSEVKSQGFSSINAPEDVVIGGHSLGGIFSQQVVGKGGYAGLVLFGSYLTSTFGYSLSSFKYPVLTLAGELDGLTRITRIGQEWQGMQQRIAADGHSALYKFPVVALPGQTHSQFCSGVNVTSFGTKDLRPEVSYPTAHAAIGEAVSHFLQLVHDPSDATAKTYIDTKYTYTQSLLAGWLSAQAEESQWCAQAQQINAANVTAHFTVNTTSCGNFASFDVEYPSVNAGSSQVQVVDELQHKANPTDSSLTSIAATEIDCKVMTEKALLRAFGQSNATDNPQGCKAANEAAMHKAFSLVPTETLSRYQKEGKPFAIQDDSKYSTGVTWQSAAFVFKSNSDNVQVQSPILTSGNNVLCKLLSPSKIVEYMMVDGLPRFDGSVI